MRISFEEMKKIVYSMMAVLGAFLLLVSALCFSLSANQANPLSFFATALILLAAGSLCLLFAFTTCLIWEDPEVRL